MAVQHIKRMSACKHSTTGTSDCFNVEMLIVPEIENIAPPERARLTEASAPCFSCLVEFNQRPHIPPHTMEGVPSGKTRTVAWRRAVIGAAQQ